MYPPHFDYARVDSVADALALLGQHEDAKLLAGGHSLIPVLKLRQARPGMLVDIGRILDLKGFDNMKGSMHIGALTTHAMIAGSMEVPEALAEAAGIVADLQVRNRGTIGGNVVHADPGSDFPIVLTALGATFHIHGLKDERAILASDFFMGMFETTIDSHEILTGVEIPIQGRGAGSAYAKMIHPASGYAMLGVAASLTMEDGRCGEASVALGGLTPKPIRMPGVESALVGKMMDDAAIVEAAKAFADDLGGDLLSDNHASADYRKAMAPIYIERAVKNAANRGKQRLN